METPIELEFVGKKDDMYALKYPGLQVPINVNFELLEKFKKSTEYIVKESPTFLKNQENPWMGNTSPDSIRA
ncbi:MAG: hypothetical protein NWQ06_00900 [Leeuwenhoekiella sp.]|nr:hypothetical protein [Leeuwenhoekiella sp.]